MFRVTQTLLYPVEFSKCHKNGWRYRKFPTQTMLSIVFPGLYLGMQLTLSAWFKSQGWLHYLFVLVFTNISGWCSSGRSECRICCLVSSRAKPLKHRSVSSSSGKTASSGARVCTHRLSYLWLFALPHLQEFCQGECSPDKHVGIKACIVPAAGSFLCSF